VIGALGHAHLELGDNSDAAADLTMTLEISTQAVWTGWVLRGRDEACRLGTRLHWHLMILRHCSIWTLIPICRR
jgi:hypothetical protein